MLRKKRAVPLSSLAFIDVMSCGLGAVILLFFLLDFQEPAGLESEEPERPVAQNPVDLDALDIEKAELERLIRKHSRNISQLIEKVSNTLLQKAANTVLIAQKSGANDEVAPISEPIGKNMAASGDLIGLSVSGRRILILFDVSASMSEETLIEIILGISDSSGTRLGAGPKWAKAKRIVTWTLQNAPPSSSVQILAYSDKVIRLTSTWTSPKDALAQFDQSAAKLSPIGGTSLGKVLEFVQSNAIAATDIYVITDGLPTLAGDKLSGPSVVKSCFRLPSNKPVYVEGACRAALFIAAVERFEKQSNAKVNIILLPLEGDPKAASFYWAWAKSNGGVLFSPARGWP